MSQFLGETVVQSARKSHACSCCWGIAVEPGGSYKRQTYIFDGRVYDWIQCDACKPLLDTVWEWAGQPDEGVNEDTYLEWARDHEDDAKYGESARAYLARHNAWYRRVKKPVDA